MKYFLPILLSLSFLGCAHSTAENSAMVAADKNKAVAVAYYEAYNAKSIDGQLSLMTDGVIYVSNSGKTREGKEAYRKYTEGLFAEVSEKVIEIKYIVDPQQLIVVAHGFAEGAYVTTSPGLPKARGQKYRIPVVEIFEFKDSQIVKLSTIYNEDMWKQQISAQPPKK